MAPFVLVFNHSETLLTLFRVNLEARGYRVVTHLQDLGSVAMVIDLTPDLIILGYLPGRVESEMALFDALRADPLTTTIPIMLCPTRIFSAVDRALLESSETVKILQKPFAAKSLVDTVKGLIDGPPNVAPPNKPIVL